MNTASEQRPEQQDGSGPGQQEQRKPPGRPFQAGDPRINRQGRPRKDADDDPGEVVAAGPVDVLAEMEALLSRPAADDRTDFQRKLRKQYDDDFDGYMDRLARLKGKGAPKDGEGCPECARRKAEEEAPDEGAENALAVLDRVLFEIGEQVNGGKR